MNGKKARALRQIAKTYKAQDNEGRRIYQDLKAMYKRGDIRTN